MYDKSHCGKRLGKFMSVSLAWWHNYKWATNMIARVFSSDFFVPLYHHIFPDRQCNISKISHTALVTFCSYIRLAYPSFRMQLQNALAVDISNRQRVLLTNLMDLCEFFIPVVYIYIQLFDVCMYTIMYLLYIYIYICMYIHIYPDVNYMLLHLLLIYIFMLYNINIYIYIYHIGSRSLCENEIQQP